MTKKVPSASSKILSVSDIGDHPGDASLQFGPIFAFYFKNQFRNSNYLISAVHKTDCMTD